MHAFISMFLIRNFIISVSVALLLAGCFDENAASAQIEPKEQGFVEVENGKIFYQIFSENAEAGVPIIVLHGGPGLDQTYLQPQLLKLAKNNKLIFYDQRGSGESLETEINESTINIKRFVSDLETVRKHLNLEQFVLMGHSWGGLLAMEYATTYPQNLLGLALVNTVPANYKGSSAFAEQLMKSIEPINDKIKPLFSFEEFAKQNAQELSKIYRDLFAVYFYNANEVEKLTLQFNTRAAQSGFKVREEMSQTYFLHPSVNLFPKLENLSTATLIIHGKQDIVPYWTAAEINTAVKNSTLVLLEECGHFPYIEQEEKFMESVEEFLLKLQHKQY